MDMRNPFSHENIDAFKMPKDSTTFASIPTVLFSYRSLHNIVDVSDSMTSARFESGIDYHYAQ